MAHRVVFPARDQVEVEQFEADSVGEDSMRVRTLYSLISNGTETIALHSLFDEDTHWANWVHYPFRPGYSAVGVVEEVGPRVTDFAVGDHVAARVAHASQHTLASDQCFRIPEGVPLEQACWFGLAKIALMGARAAQYQLGDTVAVIGAGPIGQMAIRWANAAGAMTVVAVATRVPRLELARRGGATDVVASTVEEAREDVIAACGERPRVVVDCTGNASAFASTLSLVADHGRVVLLGDTGSPTRQHLTSDVVVRGVNIVGAHDGHSRTRQERDQDRSLHELFFQLVRTGRFDLEALITHTFKPKDCALAYDTVTQRREDTMGILFDWSAL